jgi:type III restriction enzyme
MVTLVPEKFSEVGRVQGNFFEQPVLNSPYNHPGKHWELLDGQPSGNVIETRRESAYYSPVPKAKKGRKGKQAALQFADDLADPLDEQEYVTTKLINEIRAYVAQWRAIPNPNDWGVTPETARLLQHWRHHKFSGPRPFFCQVEAVETAIWVTEVAPKLGAAPKGVLGHLKQANQDANPELFRVALKLATGAGKTTVMAMLIAWMTVNAKRHPGSKAFSRGFLIVAPGLTIKDRLRVLLPNDLDSYYRSREIVPSDMLPDLDHAKIVITNYHAFKLRERMDVAKGTRQAIEGWRGEKLQTLETEGQMIQRVMPDLMGLKNIVVLNDEAHHCYRAKPKNPDEDEDDLKGEDKDEAKKNNEEARMWITGLETVKKQLGLTTVYDLSATPFFLKGSGYREGTLFPWTASDFSLMDAIECGIVKLPRVPVADNVLGGEMPMFRTLWEHIGKQMPKKGRSKSGGGSPDDLPLLLKNAIDTLYGHYVETYDVWEQHKIEVPPVFIVVCHNTTASELVYNYISGYLRENEDGTEETIPGKCKLFDNFDSYQNRRPRPNTILIDSAQLESGDALSDDFRKLASVEIDQFKREIVERTGNRDAAENLSDAALLREVMNTVGRKGKLGEQIRCVVSVGMLTEGWDANTVTHILGVRAFGTQLLCEQVVGRGLRRQSYELNEEGLFNVEYADIFGIPFDFTAKPVISKPAPPRKTVRVHAVRPERDALEILFPRVTGYRIDLPKERLDVTFNADAEYHLTPAIVGPAVTRAEGIIGKGVDMTLEILDQVRQSELAFNLASHLLNTKYRDAGDSPKVTLFPQLLRIARQWLDGGYLKCSGGTKPAQLLYKQIADQVANRIAAAITISQIGQRPVKAVIDAYNPRGLSGFVNFTTSREDLWTTAANKCHVNYVTCDSTWEEQFCQIAESHPKVLAYVKNQGLGFEVPYLMGAEVRRYIPDFIVRIDDGQKDPLNLVVEIKGFRAEDAKAKADTMRAYWVPGVNNLGRFGRWEFVEFRDGYSMKSDFEALIEQICKTGSLEPATEQA